VIVDAGGAVAHYLQDGKHVTANFDSLDEYRRFLKRMASKAGMKVNRLLLRYYVEPGLLFDADGKAQAQRFVLEA
jgi:hypothetical protein